MKSSASIVNELSSLRKDAAKVVEELSHLSHRATRLTTRSAADAVEGLSEAAVKDWEAMIEGVRSAASDAAHQVKRIDRQVKRHPYAFLMGVLGAAFIAGAFLSRRSR